MSSGQDTVGAPSIEALLAAWTQAERSNDGAALEPLLAEDFAAGGPAGFIVERPGWVSRYRGGELANDAFDWDTASVREYDGWAIVVGRQRQDTRFRGMSNAGEFRGTLVLTRRAGSWQLVALQLSPLSWRPPGMPVAGPPTAAPDWASVGSLSSLHSVPRYGVTVQR